MGRSSGFRIILLAAPSQRLFGASGVSGCRNLEGGTLSGFRPQSPLRDSAGLSPVFPAPTCSRLAALKALLIITRLARNASVAAIDKPNREKAICNQYPTQAGKIKVTTNFKG